MCDTIKWVLQFHSNVEATNAISHVTNFEGRKVERLLRVAVPLGDPAAPDFQRIAEFLFVLVQQNSIGQIEVESLQRLLIARLVDREKLLCRGQIHWLRSGDDSELVLGLDWVIGGFEALQNPFLLLEENIAQIKVNFLNIQGDSFVKDVDVNVGLIRSDEVGHLQVGGLDFEAGDGHSGGRNGGRGAHGRRHLEAVWYALEVFLKPLYAKRSNAKGSVCISLCRTDANTDTNFCITIAAYSDPRKMRYNSIASAKPSKIENIFPKHGQPVHNPEKTTEYGASNVLQNCLKIKIHKSSPNLPKFQPKKASKTSYKS
ncbi:hypothetical protein L596_019281 [Steinernema carpocapsae]|uniref:Uncharacterized protein n=1 Tax=Steinernema carpocapsae TaxID=34508 RepID=A0A4U5MQK7_STECR|nr:hypothetical protein L596_019281 [Steinernema carpocapsae]